MSSNIIYTPFETEMVDVMGPYSRHQINVDKQHGMIALLDVMPRLVPKGSTADFAIVQAARVSYGQGTKKVSEDRGLIRYLLRNHHNTPLEMCEFKFHCVMPIFVARQWIRHRTANVNEYSGRYSIIPDRFYRPERDNICLQSKSNRQGSDIPVDDITADDFLSYLDKVADSYKDYEKLIEKGLSREHARIGLPVNMYTEWYWKCDLHNMFHFLELRMDGHAQKEIRDFANAMFDLIKPIVPHACEAFEDYRLNGLHLTGLEIEALRNNQPLKTTNEREQTEFEHKKKILNLTS